MNHHLSSIYCRGDKGQTRPRPRASHKYINTKINIYSVRLKTYTHTHTQKKTTSASDSSFASPSPSFLSDWTVRSIFTTQTIQELMLVDKLRDTAGRSTQGITFVNVHQLCSLPLTWHCSSLPPNNWLMLRAPVKKRVFVGRLEERLNTRVNVVF